MFGDTDYDPDMAFSGAVPLEEQLEALGRAVAAGKVGLLWLLVCWLLGWSVG